MRKYLLVLSVFCVAICFSACRDLYRAGSGMRYLDYPIEQRLDATLIMNYIDTAKAYTVPKEWEDFHLLDDLAPDQNKRIYFSEQPREMYLISVGGMRTLGLYFIQIKFRVAAGSPIKLGYRKQRKVVL